ncbi:TVP38/TMEM64 family protein [Candidatus Woesearchaeota archaeon]|nr:TVP38/TMEM64 family protein [Candidatus Woesearchaeota archaeon]
MKKRDRLKSHKVVKFVKVGIFILLLVGACYLLSSSPWTHSFLDNPAVLKELITSFGAIAPLVLVLLQTVDNIVPFIPTELIYVVAGFIFGPVFGLIYSLIGAFLGSAIVFMISRRYGKELAEKLFAKKEIIHFSLFFRKNKAWAVFIARVAPLFPNDLISFAAGLTNLKFWRFNLISTLGFGVETIILTYFGAELSKGISVIPLIILGLFIGISILIKIFREKIKRTIIKDIHKLEKEGKDIEKEIENEFRKI